MPLAFLASVPGPRLLDSYPSGSRGGYIFPLLFDLAGIGCSSPWEQLARPSARPATARAAANQVLFEI